MNFKLLKNTHIGGMSLHNDYGYAMCPYKKNATCGTWCALFHLNEERSSVLQACAQETIFLNKEVIDEEAT